MMFCVCNLWRLIKEKKKEKKFKTCSGSQKPQTGSEIHACLKDRLTGTKKKSISTSAFTVELKGPSFTQLLAGSSSVHSVPDLSGVSCSSSLY